jgi:hypothetical protein
LLLRLPVSLNMYYYVMLQTCKLSKENQKTKKNKDWCFWLQASFVFRDCSEAVFFVSQARQELGTSSFPARIELLNAFPSTSCLAGKMLILILTWVLITFSPLRMLKP